MSYELLSPIMTTEKNGSTLEDPTELMTTTVDVADHTTGSSMTSWSLRGAGFYFQCTIVVIAVLGTAANGLILYAMVASKQHKKQVLIFNQNLLNFVSCIFLYAAHSARLGNAYRTEVHGHWLCAIALVEGFSWGPFASFLIILAYMLLKVESQNTITTIYISHVYK